MNVCLGLLEMALPAEALVVLQEVSPVVRPGDFVIHFLEIIPADRALAFLLG